MKNLRRREGGRGYKEGGVERKKRICLIREERFAEREGRRWGGVGRRKLRKEMRKRERNQIISFNRNVRRGY